MNERFARTLRMLGYVSYDAYLAGPVWSDFRRRYAAAGRPSLCRVCGSCKVTLHHTTYERLGCERFDDVMPLCWTHHKAVHRWLERSRLPVEASERAVAFLRERQRPRKPRSRQTGYLWRRRSL